MEENKREMFLHDWVVEEIKVQYYKEFNEIKYPNDNETRIVFATLKPMGTVTTAPKV